MPNWKNLVIATAFMGFAAYLYLHHGSPWMIGLSFAASLYLGVLAFTGLSAGGVVDLCDAVDFVVSPTQAIVDRAARALPAKPVSKLTAMIDGDDEAKSGFDPDAVIERYLAERPAGAPPLAAPSPAPRTFGRRGL